MAKDLGASALAMEAKNLEILCAYLAEHEVPLLAIEDAQRRHKKQWLSHASLTI